MISTEDVHEDIKVHENNALNLRKLELTNLKLIASIMEKDNWEDIDFNLSIPKTDKYKDLDINMFCFKDCMDKEIIEAIKKLLKIGCERAIIKRESFIKSYEDFMK